MLRDDFSSEENRAKLRQIRLNLDMLLKSEKGSNKDKIGRRGTYGENLVNPTTPFLIWDDLLKMSVNFHDFLPLPPSVSSFFTTIQRQIWPIFDPSPLKNADVSNGWSLMPIPSASSKIIFTMFKIF